MNTLAPRPAATAASEKESTNSRTANIPNGGETTLDKVVAGLAAELGVDENQGGRRFMDEVPDASKQTEFPVVARHPS